MIENRRNYKEINDKFIEKWIKENKTISDKNIWEFLKKQIKKEFLKELEDFRLPSRSRAFFKFFILGSVTIP